jgi:hypothetical protein
MVPKSSAGTPIDVDLLLIGLERESLEVVFEAKFFKKNGDLVTIRCCPVPSIQAFVIICKGGDPYAEYKMIGFWDPEAMGFLGLVKER